MGETFDVIAVYDAELDNPENPFPLDEKIANACIFGRFIGAGSDGCERDTQYRFAERADAETAAAEVVSICLPSIVKVSVREVTEAR